MINSYEKANKLSFTIFSNQEKNSGKKDQVAFFLNKIWVKLLNHVKVQFEQEVADKIGQI